MCIPGLFGGGGGDRAAEKLQQQQADQATADAKAKAEKLRTGMAGIDNAFGGFNEDYFSGLAKNYTDYATPQLKDQYDEAKKNIVYSLARKGNLASTTAGDQYALLDKENARNLTGISSTAGDYANSARRDVAANKNEVIGQLNSTYDADSSVNDALSRSRMLATPPSFSPLGNLFTNISALAAQNRLASDGRDQGGGGARTYGINPSSSYLRYG